MRWKILENDGNAYIAPDSFPNCIFCGTQLVLHDFYARYSTLHDFYHCDVHLKCPSCSWYVTFGVPITREEFEKLSKSKYHGRILKDELLDLGFDVVRKRLESWGYW